MPKIYQSTKQKRIETVFHLLKRHPDGLTEKEIAEEVNITRRTVNNYLRELEIQGKLYKEGQLWLIMPHQQAKLRPFELSPEEAMTLYLATRLLVKQHDKRNESAETALSKLAEALTGDLNVGEEVYQAALELAQRPGDESYSHTFRTMMQSYIYRRRVEIKYSPMRGKSFQTSFAPYLLEPSAIGYATYIIGHSSIVDDLRTYKLQRIQEASLTTEEYIVPDGFPGLEYLRSAWSIIAGDNLVEVKLRFTPRVTKRVRESQWHPSEKVVADPENPQGCIWSAKIGDLTDFTPWVRSWGADVEVLAPEELRGRLVRESRKMALLYDVGDVSPPPLYQQLWAKTSDDKTQTHPLICHMIDVAQVALTMWNEVLTDGIRAQLADALGLDEEDAGRLIAFWAGLHDLGKASPCFQRKYAPAMKPLAEAGLPFKQKIGQKACHHGAVTTQSLTDLLIQKTGLVDDWAYNIAVAVGGHHGDWPTPEDLDHHTGPLQRGGEPWDQVRRTLFVHMEEIVKPPDEISPSSSIEEVNTFFALLSGLTSVADWIGSKEDYFEPASEYVNLAEYVEHAARQAERALKETGWLEWQPSTSAISFESLCDVPAPRPLQEVVIDLAHRLEQPALVIIEAPTGVGKTEAALYLADYWNRMLHQRGTYVAMPTMATSNQMFDRVGKVLKRRYPDEVVNYHLLHGNAMLMDEDQLPRLAKISDIKADGKGTVAALSWFTKRKRGLLAPFAVGTVDQALMSILQTPHFFIRLFGLSHKTVIFDEIHAYDTYMEELFYLLLRWLRVMNTSVVILSATLPEQSRRRLIQAYTGKSQADIPTTSYPVLTWATEDQIGAMPLEASVKREVELERIERNPETIARRLADELQAGGCAAVICNTVGRAQEIYRSLQETEVVPEENLILFHARFPFAWREQIERRVLSLFGKSGERPKKAIVVATQVIEQSLDLDFDLMVSDLAPVDLVIQRIGRLHRHEDNRDNRPSQLATPRLLLAMPENPEDVPKFDRGDVHIYGQYLMLRSYLTLHQCNSIMTPDETQALIESVYGSEDLLPSPLSDPMHKALDKARKAMEKRERCARSEADSKLIPLPNDKYLLERSNARLDEDNPELHKYRRAATRLAPPSITLICLHQTSRGLGLDPDPDSPLVDLDQKPDWETTKALFSRKIDTSDYRLVKYFADQPVPDKWEKNAWLRHTRPVVFEDGVCYLSGVSFYLELDPKLGLIVKNKEEV